MSKIMSITCDGCQKPIDPTTGYASEAYLELDNRYKGHSGGSVFAMSLSPDIDGTKHFHHINCLKQFLEANYETQ